MTDRLLLRRLASDERAARNLLEYGGSARKQFDNGYNLGRAHAYAQVTAYLQQRMRRRPTRKRATHD